MTPTFSALPRLAICPGSAALPQADSTSEHADDGVANHADAETAVKYGEVERLPMEIRALMPKGSQVYAETPIAYDFASDTARILEGVVGRLYATARGGLRATEVPGTPDLHIVTPDGELVVIDYKLHTDIGSPDESAQVMGYTLALARLHRVDRARVAVAYIESDDDGHVTLTRPLVVREVDGLDLDAFAAKLRNIIRAVDEQRGKAIPDVRESSKCRYCPSMPYCPPKQALITRLANGGEANELELLMPLTPERAGMAWERLKHIEAMIKRFRGAMYAIANEHDLPLPNGKILTKRQGNERLDGDVVAAVLREKYGDAVADLATMKREGSKSGLERALKTAAGVTSVSRAKEDALTEIRKRGGVSHDRDTFVERAAVPGLATQGRAGQGEAKRSTPLQGSASSDVRGDANA